ncbi:Peptide-methionine (R)-S-oxide reductase [Aphelenchoides besseyi]|nr:Peptide-methionine (R)-S-oxide reductase [Aphelenchoides besseyi]KAI6231571.1 Peptide-methionine (R)-S-oxide reductase [Aphelenchoides besseyi]
MSSQVPMFKKLTESLAEQRRAVFRDLCDRFGGPNMIPDDAWKEQLLSAQEFRVCRLGSVETRNLLKNWRPGNYFCLCCGTALFDSNDKYYATHGWLSFSRSIGGVERVTTSCNGLKRVEVKCKECHSHLGLICPDSVSETGERFTINSAALVFEIEKFDDALRRYTPQPSHLFQSCRLELRT